MPALATGLPTLRALFSWRPRTLSARLARVGVWVLLLYVLIALLSPLLFQLGLLPDVNSGLHSPINAPPSLEHWCGTNRLGQDVCARTIAGAGVALQVVVLALSLALVIGVPLGMLSGYFGGPLDRALVLLMDTLYSLPMLMIGSLGFLGWLIRSGCRVLVLAVLAPVPDTVPDLVLVLDFVFVTVPILVLVLDLVFVPVPILVFVLVLLRLC